MCAWHPTKSKVREYLLVNGERQVTKHSASSKKLYDVYGEETLTERQCQNWFARFRFGDFDLKDSTRSGHQTEVDDDKIKAMIENNRRSATREKLNISLIERNSTHQTNFHLQFTAET